MEEGSVETSDEGFSRDKGVWRDKQFLSRLGPPVYGIVFI